MTTPFVVKQGDQVENRFDDINVAITYACRLAKRCRKQATYYVFDSRVSENGILGLVCSVTASAFGTLTLHPSTMWPDIT